MDVTEWSFAETMLAFEVAQLFSVTSKTVWRWADSGHLVTRINPHGRGRVYSAAQVRALLAQEAERPSRRIAQGRAYQAALRELRAAHPDEFDVFYAARLESELASDDKASPAGTGDALNPERQ